MLVTYPDTAFTIGQAHFDTAKPCQDYSLAVQGLGQSWVVISDGCSTGGRTDMGARMWCQAFMHGLPTLAPEGRYSLEGYRLMLLSEVAPLLAPFDVTDGYATVGIAGASAKGAHAALFGDGVIVIKKKNGNLVAIVVEFEKNTPRYLSYERDPLLLAQWQSQVADSKVWVTTTEYAKGGEVLSEFREASPAETFTGFWRDWEDCSDFSYLMVMTDGALSFGHPSTFESLQPLSDIRNPVGVFVQRKMGALARKWRKAGGLGPMDDLAIGAIGFGAGNE
jgi:hypothetical protein